MTGRCVGGASDPHAVATAGERSRRRRGCLALAPRCRRPRAAAPRLHATAAATSASGAPTTDGLPFFRYGIDQIDRPARHERREQPHARRSTSSATTASSPSAGTTATRRCGAPSARCSGPTSGSPTSATTPAATATCNVDGKVLSTLYLDRPEGARVRRATSASATTAARMRAEGLDGRARTPTRRSATTRCCCTTSRSPTRPTATRKVSWFEYWDVNPYNRAQAHNRPTLSAAYDASGRR